MLAVVIATGLAGAVTRDTIYTLKLLRRGIDVDAHRTAGPMQTLTVADAMRPLPGSVASELPLEALIERLSRGREQALPVVDPGGALVGVVSAEDLEPALADLSVAETAAGLARPAPALRPGDTLEAAARLLSESEEAGLPVLAADGSSVVAWVTHSDLLHAYLAHGRTGSTSS